MILVNQNNSLIYKQKIYRCSLGINGLNESKIEGDKSTPIGIFSLGNLYVRTDRIKDLKTHFKYLSISPNKSIKFVGISLIKLHAVALIVFPSIRK